VSRRAEHLVLASFESGERASSSSASTVDRAWGISWHLGVDGISLFLVVLTGVLFPLVIVGTTRTTTTKRYLAWMLLLEAGVMGSFLSLDLFLFFVFFEIVLVPMYFLIGGWGYEHARLRGDEVLPVHDVRLGVHARRHRRHRGARQRHGSATHVRPRRDRRERQLRRVDRRWLFFAFAIAFAVKVPMFPLHTWLPDAHTQAPTAAR
jgi:NADH-quinone oxidoreductase subunit M